MIIGVLVKKTLSLSKNDQDIYFLWMPVPQIVGIMHFVHVFIH